MPSVVEELIAVGRFAFERGWLPATSGNLSARLDPERVVITASGCSKGALRADDFSVVDRAGRVSGGARPSAETALHLGLYRRDETIGAVLHTHSRASIVLSRLNGPGALVLEGYELQKAFEGVTTHASRIEIPVVDNDQDVSRLSSVVESRLSNAPAFLIAGHGVYAWGGSVRDALRHLEALEHLLECEIETRRLSR